MGNVPELMVKMLVRAVVTSLVHAVFLRAAAKWVAKVDLPYKNAYGLTLLISLTGGMSSIFFLAVFSRFTAATASVILILAVTISIATSIVLATIVYGSAIRNDDGTPIGMLKGFFTTLAHIAIGAAVAGVVVLIVVLAAKIIG